ncbi:3-hydroxyacyl-CoA dehyrogenase [Aspergillus flavus AF70]|nr:3-hydroxyacyl-CoA dehyrogenase [Aspergillus flavus AF70]
MTITTMKDIKTVAIIGTGVIGASWTALFLARGLKVLVTDPAPNAEKNLETYLNAQWPTLTQIGLSEGASLKNYAFVDSLDNHFEEIDFIQENGPERLEFKRTLFAYLDEKARPEVIIASSSSGIPSSEYASACRHHPERVLVGHPFNPPHLIPLVEVVPHRTTDRETVVPRAMEFYRSLGKKPVLIQKEIPGFIANRLQAALSMEAYSLVSRGIISAADLDTTVTSSLGLRWALNGPYALNAMAGGGSFQHFLGHLGPAAKSWHDDMHKHTFSMTPEAIQDLSRTVEPMVQATDLNTLQKERDDVLLKLIDMKSKTSLLE